MVPSNPKDPRLVVLGALKAEMARSMERLRLPKEDPPYFLRYLVRDYDETDISARLGALLNDDHTRARQAMVEARVGEYQFDNTADDTADKMFDVEDFDKYEPPTIAPIDGDVDALRATLWLQTDVKYKRALSLLHKKRGARVTKVVEDESVASFSREEAARAVDPAVNVKVDRAAWADRLRRVSASFRSYPEIFDSQIKLNVSHQTRFVVTSEGTELINERLIWAVHFSATGRAPDGLLVPHFKSFYGASESELPDEKTLISHRAPAGRRDPQAGRGADDGSVQRAGDLAARGRGRVLSRGAGAPAGGRAAERQQRRRHLQGPDRQPDLAHLPHHHRRSHAGARWARSR